VALRAQAARDVTELCVQPERYIGGHHEGSLALRDRLDGVVGGGCRIHSETRVRRYDDVLEELVITAQRLTLQGCGPKALSRQQSFLAIDIRRADGSGEANR
jgi:hypothetical protein